MFERLQSVGAILAKQMSQPHGAYILAPGNQCSKGKNASDLECCFQLSGEERPLLGHEI